MVPVTNAAGTGTPTIGAVIPTGSYITSIAADRTSDVWVSTEGSPVYIIANGTSTATVVSGIVYRAGVPATPFFGGVFARNEFDFILVHKRLTVQHTPLLAILRAVA